MRTKLAKIQGKGKGVVATSPIRKGHVIAYYCMVAVPKKMVQHDCLMTLYSKTGHALRKYVGDVDHDQDNCAYRGVPCYGHYINEPSPGQSTNAFLCDSPEINFRTRKKVKLGDKLRYRVIASRDIQPGEEITWYYGDEYERAYDIGDV